MPMAIRGPVPVARNVRHQAALQQRLCRIFAVRTLKPTNLAGQPLDKIGVPWGIRTPVAAVRGRCPGPLDEGDAGPARRRPDALS